MDDSKVWYTSKTVWGSIIAVVAGIAGAFGFQLDIAGQEVITSAIVSLVGLAGGLIALWGRLRATKATTLTTK